MSVTSKLFKGSLIVLILAVGIAAIHLWLNTKTYLFSEKNIAELGRKAISLHGSNHIAMFAFLEKELSKRYPGHVIPEHHRQWIYVNAGGWMGAMYLLHCSITEYVLLFGTAIDTSGHSGRYWANVSDVLLTGSFRQWPEGTVESVMYQPGDFIHHGWGEVTGVQWTAGTWMFEYGRGFIPSTMVFALADTIFGTTDFYVFLKTLKIFVIGVVQEMSQGQF